jgi:DNA-binding response OmpR family regulator
VRPSVCACLMKRNRSRAASEYSRKPPTVRGAYAQLLDESKVPLSEKEVALLRYLVAHSDRVVTREELLSRVWGLDPRGIQTRTVDMHVARIRERLQDDLKDPKVILTVRARGYRIGELSCE